MRFIVPLGAILFSLALLQSGTARAISMGQIDTFGDGTLQGWQMGVGSVTASHMTNIADGGPAGTGDNFLQVVADGPNAQGRTVPGGRLTFFNRQQWTGDYTAAGISAIAMDLKNLSTSTTLNLRLAIDGGTTGGVFATSTSIILDIGSDWTRVVFSLLPGDLIPVSGALSGNTSGIDAQAALANVQELRLFNSAPLDYAPVNWAGLAVAGTLGIDNIQAVPLPPALALFGSGLIVLLTGWRRKILQPR